jgi:hypothetical protein
MTYNTLNQPRTKTSLLDRINDILLYIVEHHGEGERRRYLDKQWADEIHSVLVLAHGKFNMLDQHSSEIQAILRGVIKA